MDTGATRDHPDLHDPVWDRAAGALAGAAAATARSTPVPAPLARLIRAALTDLNAGTALPHPPPDPLDHAWAQALRTLVLTAAPPRTLLEHTPADRPPSASWRALTRTPVPAHDPARGIFACHHLTRAVRSAHAAAGDLTAMYTGALAGARWGFSALPLRSLRHLAADPHTLVTDALTAARGHRTSSWPHAPIRTGPSRRLPPFAVPHPLDDQVLLGNLDHLRTHPDSADAAVSLCRTHPDDAPHLPARDWTRVWLHDRPGANPNLHFALDEAAAAVATLRAEGKRVLLHCWAGASRTPAVAARYAAAHLGAPALPTLALLIRTVGGHLDNPTLARAVAALSGQDLPEAAAHLFPDGIPPRRPELPEPHNTG
ncbi:protein phosphatase [Nocardiopsis algeriensis]|uniref:Dual specificity protein phosphatase-like protein n=1 Tax=Nocardiopsis algeriensis TaxID=1478215 RepID=A0A841IPA1_9ACTN|nr:hypothetical protein [Nocardiopsis algeriensis]